MEDKETADWRNWQRRRKRRVLPKILLMIVVAIPAFGFVVMELWNWLMPAVFGLRTIDFWHALGILVLSKILFGGFRGRPRGGSRGLERWEKMTPEERAKVVEAMRTRRGCGTPPEAAPQTPA